MPEHNTVSDPYIHEPKGVSTAAAGQVYVANGSGSGTWTTQTSVGYTLTGSFPDISVAGDRYIAAPFAGTLARIDIVVHDSPSVNPTVISVDIGAGSVIDGDITIPAGSAVGTAFNSTPTGGNAVAAGDVIKLTSDGGSTGAAEVCYTLYIT